MIWRLILNVYLLLMKRKLQESLCRMRYIGRFLMGYIV